MTHLSLVVREPASESYAASKLRALFRAELRRGDIGYSEASPLPDSIFQTIEQQIPAHDPGTPLPLSDTVSISPGLQTLMRRRVTENSPSIDGEHVLPQGERFSRLTETWGRFPKGALVLSRKTNLAHCHYILETSSPYVFTTQGPDMSLVATATSGSGYTFGDVALKLANGLVGELPSPANVVGAVLLDVLFPSNNSDPATVLAKVWDDLLKQIQKILTKVVKDQSATDSLLAAESHLGTFQSNMNVQYKNKKKTGTQANDLITYLQSQLQLLENYVIFTYNDTDLAVEGLANYLLAVGLYIGVFQEMAMVDPDHPGKPYDSQYGDDAGDFGVLYADKVEQLIQPLHTSRAKFITTPPKFIDEFPSHTKYYHYESTDTYNGLTVKIQGQSYTEPAHGEGPFPSQYTKDLCLTSYNAALKAYTDQLKAEITQYIKKTTSLWRRLKYDPVPVDYALSGKRAVSWAVYLDGAFKKPGNSAGVTAPLDPSPHEVIVFRSGKEANNEIVFSIIYDAKGLTSICRFYSGGQQLSEVYGRRVGPGEKSHSMWSELYFYNWMDASFAS